MIVRGLFSPTTEPLLVKSLYVVISHLLRSPATEIGIYIGEHIKDKLSRCVKPVIKRNSVLGEIMFEKGIPKVALKVGEPYVP